VPRLRQDIEIERVQTGVRIERRLLKVLKALAEYKKHELLATCLKALCCMRLREQSPFTADTQRKNC